MTAALANRLEAITAEAAAVLRQPMPARDWLDEALDPHGDGLKSDEAGYVMGCSADTARRRAESAAAIGKPIAILVANAVWLFSERRVLSRVEAEFGLPARLAAETRAKKNADLRSLQQKSVQMPIANAS
jgi:hypothetical protein